MTDIQPLVRQQHARQPAPRWHVRVGHDRRERVPRIALPFRDVREPTEPQWSLSLFKNTRIGDRLNAQVRIETFNVFNVRLYGGPGTNPNDPAAFGVVNTTSQINFARTTQLSLRLQF